MKLLKSVLIFASIFASGASCMGAERDIYAEMTDIDKERTWACALMCKPGGPDAPVNQPFHLQMVKNLDI